MTDIAIQDGVLATTLDGDIDASTPTLDVATGTGATMPPVPFPIQADAENMMVTVVAGDTFTVERGLGDTIEAAHASGAAVRHVVTAASFPTRKDDTTGAYAMQDDLDLNGHDLLGAPSYGCIVGRAAAFTFVDAGSGFTVMTWDQLLHDEGGCWKPSNGSRFTAPVAGFYTLISNVGAQTAALASDLIVWRHTVDGAVQSYITDVWPNSDWPVYNQSFTVWMEAGEYLELWYQNDNASYPGWNSTTITRASFMRTG